MKILLNSVLKKSLSWPQNIRVGKVTKNKTLSFLIGPKGQEKNVS